MSHFFKSPLPWKLSVPLMGLDGFCFAICTCGFSSDLVDLLEVVRLFLYRLTSKWI